MAIPGSTLLSCIMYFIFNFWAALQTGIQIYPPVPIIISGLNFLIMFFASATDFIVLINLETFSSVKLLLIPYASIVLSSYPALSTRSFSNPLDVPIKIIFESGSSTFILFAIAIPWVNVPSSTSSCYNYSQDLSPYIKF